MNIHDFPQRYTFDNDKDKWELSKFWVKFNVVQNILGTENTEAKAITLKLEKLSWADAEAELSALQKKGERE